MCVIYDTAQDLLLYGRNPGNKLSDLICNFQFEKWYAGAMGNPFDIAGAVMWCIHLAYMILCQLYLPSSFYYMHESNLSSRILVTY